MQRGAGDRIKLTVTQDVAVITANCRQMAAAAICRRAEPSKEPCLVILTNTRSLLFLSITRFKFIRSHLMVSDIATTDVIVLACKG